MKKNKKQKHKAKTKQLTPAKREEVRAKAQAMVDVALGAPPAATNGHGKKKIVFPGAEELADATWNLKRVLNKYAQSIYTKVLSETIIRLQNAKRKNIV